MSEIITRESKGAALTNPELDANFTNLNAGKMEKSANLSDVVDVATARSNLGVVAENIPFTPSGSLVSTDVEAALNEAAAEAVQKSSNLGDLPNAATARSNLGIPASIQNSEYLMLDTVAGVNDITANASPAIAAYQIGQTFRFISAGANTNNAVTLNINGKGAKAVKKASALGPVDLVNGDIPASGIVLQLTYDGTQFQVISGAGSGGGATGGSGDKAFFENDNVIAHDYPITPGKNAGSFGPMTMADGVDVDIPIGSVWSIV